MTRENSGGGIRSGERRPERRCRCRWGSRPAAHALTLPSPAGRGFGRPAFKGRGRRCRMAQPRQPAAGAWSMSLFRFFEGLLEPTVLPPEAPPPGGLIAFYWHYARQARGLVALLFLAG